mgnify:CR=1 FL=1
MSEEQTWAFSDAAGTGAAEEGQGMIWRIQQALREGLLEEARASCEELRQQEGREGEAEHLLGLVELRAGNYEQALARTRAAMELEAERADVWANHGAAQAMAGRKEEAMGSLRRAVELDPEYEEALLNLGALLLDAGWIQEALTPLDQAIRIRPSARGFTLMASGLYASGNGESAATCAEAAYNLAPEDGETCADLIRMLSLVGHAEQAQALGERMSWQGPEKKRESFPQA